MTPQDDAFNPLDIPNIAASIGSALERVPVQPLQDVSRFSGAGIYALYYSGEFPAYSLLSRANQEEVSLPIYVGKAVPQGARKGVSVATQTAALSGRLREHKASIQAVDNLEIADFSYRYLVLEPIWIGLGESMLLNRYAPVWNGLVDGFGNHDPGAGRRKGMVSPWDVLHPGRAWAASLAPRPETPEAIAQDAAEYLRQRIAPR